MIYFKGHFPAYFKNIPLSTQLLKYVNNIFCAQE